MSWINNMDTQSLFNACYAGDFVTVNVLITFINDFNVGLRGACRGGQMEMVKYMINLGANNFNEALIHSCMSGHIDIVNLLVEKGAIHADKTLAAACWSGNKTLVEMIISKYKIIIDDGCLSFAVANHQEILYLWILEKYNTVELDRFTCLCGDGKIDKIKTMVGTRQQINDGLEIASYFGNTDIVEYLLTLIPVATSVNNAICQAISAGHYQTTKLLLEYTKLNVYTLFSYIKGVDDVTIQFMQHRYPLISTTQLEEQIISNKKEIALELIARGADINQYELPLTFDDIYYLHKRGMVDFGKYKHTSKRISITTVISIVSIEDLLLSDIIDIIISY